MTGSDSRRSSNPAVAQHRPTLPSEDVSRPLSEGDRRSEAFHSKAERLNIVLISSDRKPITDVFFCALSEENNSTHTCHLLLEIFTTDFGRPQPWSGCSGLWSDGSKAGPFKISPLILLLRQRDEETENSGQSSAGQSFF